MYVFKGADSTLLGICHNNGDMCSFAINTSKEARNILGFKSDWSDSRKEEL
jgi:hypothetical protein